MDKKDEALKMAIKAIKEFSELNLLEKYYFEDKQFSEASKKLTKAYHVCKEALEQPAQEPVEVYGILDDGDYISVEVTKEGAIKICEDMNKHDWNCTYKPLYTHPYQWQGLTDDEVNSIYVEVQTIQNLYRIIEAKLKEKNT